MILSIDSKYKRVNNDLEETNWQSFNNAFDRLPIAAIVDQSKYWGIPTSCLSLDSLRTASTPLSEPETQSPQVWEVLWNDQMTDEDFAALTHFQKTGIHESRGFAENVKRDTAYNYTQ
jgi:hypothetical protein